MSGSIDPWPNQFPRPTEWTKPTSFTPRPLLPIYPPPNSLLAPGPTVPLRSTEQDLQGFVNLGFKHSSHLVPACFLRSTPPHTLPEPAANDLSKEDRTKYNNETIETVLRMRQSYNETHFLNYHSGQPMRRYHRVYWQCINRFVRSGSGSGNLTLIVSHANGFSKEVCEPLIQFLLDSPELRDQVGEIWAFESVHHGDSALLNAKTLRTSGLYLWTDDSRDLVQFLTHFLPAQYSNSELPVVLPPVHPSERHDRMIHGLPSSRRVVAIGHSFSGCTMTLAALHYPKLFSSLILADPIVHRPVIPHPSGYPGIGMLVKGAVVRKSTWTTREEATNQFSKSPFFSSWHPAVLQRYIDHSLYSTKDGKVHLKMPPILEGVTFTELETTFAVWHLLPSLDKDVALFYVMPGQGKAASGPGGSDITRAQELVWLRPDNSTHVRIAESGHLIIQERPKEMADAVKDFLLKKYGNRISRL
ncbi:Alpha/beta hydrolase family-domain-containing protein [Flagelloscypha sp. PMI_526]|nr:Alpha/beta hydrolase family-domain-containing protein [Flagelloscypha sp. PMI_526]